MRRDLALSPLQFTSSFLSCEKDLEAILRKLFVESQPYSDDLKRLLVINMKDCLDDKSNPIYIDAIKDMSLAKLRENGYIRLEPKIKMHEHEQVKNYLFFALDNFRPNQNNPEFRDCTVHIDILCHTDEWALNGFKLRPFKICGYIDGILNNAKLSGIGTLQFIGCKEIVLDETLSGYSMSYTAIHGSDDKIPSAHGWIES